MTKDENQRPTNIRTRMMIRVPAGELAQSLASVLPVVDKTIEGIYDTVRIEAVNGKVFATAWNPRMHASVELPAAQVVGEGAIEVLSAVAKDIIEASRYKDPNAADIMVLLAEEPGGEVTAELEYGLPVPDHITRRPTVSHRQKPGAVTAYVDKNLGAATLEKVERNYVQHSPTQLSMLAKISKTMGEPMISLSTPTRGLFVAHFADRFVCTFMCIDEEESNQEADSTESELLSLASTREVHRTDLTGDVRVVGAFPVGAM